MEILIALAVIMIGIAIIKSMFKLAFVVGIVFVLYYFISQMPL